MRTAWFATLGILGALLGCSPEQSGQSDQLQAEEPQFLPATAQTTQQLEAKGAKLAKVFGCRGCHGDDLTGKNFIEEPEFAVQFSSNLRQLDPEYTPAALEATIRTGRRPDGTALYEMPSDTFQHLSRSDMAALMAYLRSLPPKGERYPRMVMGPLARQEIADGLWQSAPKLIESEACLAPVSLGKRHDVGRYLARLACGECHGSALSGNDRPYRPDLAVASAYSLDQFKTLMRTGASLDGRDIGLMGKVAPRRFAVLTDEEIAVLYRYLVARAAQPVE